MSHSGVSEECKKTDNNRLIKDNLCFVNLCFVNASKSEILMYWEKHMILCSWYISCTYFSVGLSFCYHACTFT